MNKETLKKLAKITIVDGKISNQVRDFILEKLSIKDLKTYLFYLKQELKKQKVYVIISYTPSDETRKEIFGLFKDKNVKFEVDETLGAGFKVEYNDNVIDISVKNLIEQSINKIRNEL